jgi:hypothetical protein
LVGNTPTNSSGKKREKILLGERIRKFGHLSGGYQGTSSREDSKTRLAFSLLRSAQRKRFPNRFIRAQGTICCSQQSIGINTRFQAPASVTIARIRVMIYASLHYGALVRR